MKGCDWRMSGEGRSYEAYNEPKFSTWEEALKQPKSKNKVFKN